MAYTVKDMATLSGVSVRTLHYYDEIGLLKPAYCGANGYRYYEEPQMLRLQQILFFRELEFPLEDIQAMLASDAFNQVEALTHHRALLVHKAERLQQLIATLDHTVQYLKGDTAMEHQDMYAGFRKEQQEKYVQELKDRYGQQVETYIDQSMENVKNMKRQDFDSFKQEFHDIQSELFRQFTSQAATDSTAVQAIIRQHFAMITRFYQPTREVYIGLGQLYIDHPDFRKLFDVYDPGLVDYVAAAMKVFAEQELPAEE